MKYTFTFVTLLFIGFQVVCWCSVTTVSASGITNIECKDNKGKVSLCAYDSTINITGTDFKVGSTEQLYNVGVSKEIDIYVNEGKWTTTEMSGPFYFQTDQFPPGPYEIGVPSSVSDTPLFIATLMFGKYYGIDMPTYINKPIPKDSNVSGQWYNTITEGCNFTVTGIFNTNSKYEVLFYATDASVPTANIPTCGDVTVTKNTLSCKVTKAVVNSKYTFSFIVKDATDGAYLHNTKPISSVTTVEFSESCTPYPSPDLPTLPYVTDATGECVSKSSKCTNGATLSFAGGAFDKDKMNKQIDIQGMKNAACVISDVSATALTCKLSGIDKDAKGTYPMSLQTSMTYGKTKNAKIYMGALVLGEGSTKGYTTAYNLHTVLPTTSSHVKKVTTALTVVFAILFGLALASIIFMSCKYKMIPRKVWSSITSQLSASNNNINSRPNNNNNNNDVEGDVNEPMRN